MKLFSFWRSLATYRVRIALNLKGMQPDEVIDINLMKGEQRERAFRAVNPMMAIPALVDGEGPALFESLAIIEYLDEIHPQPPLLPEGSARAGARARARADHRLRLASAAGAARARISRASAQARRGRPARRGASTGSREALTALETNLGARRPAAICHGDAVTLADICLVSQAAGAKFFQVDTTPFPTVNRIVDTCQAIDAFARAHPLKQPGAPAAV